jgi:hypothetical protein
MYGMKSQSFRGIYNKKNRVSEYYEQFFLFFSKIFALIVVPGGIGLGQPRFDHDVAMWHDPEWQCPSRV